MTVGVGDVVSEEVAGSGLSSESDLKIVSMAVGVVPIDDSMSASATMYEWFKLQHS